MEQVGTVAELWRYPVKSFQGERVDTLELAPGGALGDRTLAVIDPAAGKVLSGKRYPDLLMASARLDVDRVVLTLPDGSEHDAADPAVHDVLSRWLDLDVRLSAPPVDTVMPMEMHTGMSDDSTPIFDWPGPQGTWLDLADAHWLTTASLASIAALHPDGAWDVRRFRPTALIDATASGWPEDAWTLRCSCRPRAAPCRRERSPASIGTRPSARRSETSTTTTSACTPPSALVVRCTWAIRSTPASTLLALVPGGRRALA